MLDRRYTFETLQQDETNMQAMQACKSICEQADNGEVLWVYGPTGCGKTHLLKAVKNALAHHENTHLVVYASAKELTEVLVDFIGGGTDLWMRLHQADYLLIDNADYLLGRIQTQNAFADMMAKMSRSGKCVVLTSLCPPDQLEELKRVLSEKVSLCSVFEIRPPSKETKAEVARLFMQRHTFDMPQDVLDALIDGASNILQLNGALNCAWMYTRAGNRPDMQWLQTCVQNFW